MQKISIVLVLGILGLIFHLGCDIGENSCSSINGAYQVNKTIRSVSCQKGVASVKIQNARAILPDSSKLTITQTGCNLVATESIPGNNLFIPYTGDINSDDEFSLSVENPEQLAIPLELEISGVKYTCRFNGSIDWDGEASGDKLTGQIFYDLEKRADETEKACPSACQTNMDFSANK